jgi:hypothetical protein
MAPAVKAYYGRRNPMLSLVENEFRLSAIEQLRQAGVPEARLAAPINPAVEALVANLVRGERLAAYNREKIEPKTPARQTPFDGEDVDRELCARVICTALISQPGCGHESTAKYLNEGLPPGTQGLTRHHVLRAFDTGRRAWRRSPCADRILHVLADCDLLNALNIVYEHARAVPKLRKYRGEELAWAIHEDFDLNERIYRASKLVRPGRFDAEGPTDSRVKSQPACRLVSHTTRVQSRRRP